MHGFNFQATRGPIDVAVNPHLGAKCEIVLLKAEADSGALRAYPGMAQVSQRNATAGPYLGFTTYMDSHWLLYTIRDRLSLKYCSPTPAGLFAHR
jgi:hypothetical protein